MTPNKEANVPKFYRYRLMQVLLSKDVSELMDKLNPNSGMDLVDARYWLLDNWPTSKDAICALITARIN